MDGWRQRGQKRKSRGACIRGCQIGPDFPGKSGPIWQPRIHAPLLFRVRVRVRVAVGLVLGLGLGLGLQ